MKTLPWKQIGVYLLTYLLVMGLSYYWWISQKGQHLSEGISSIILVCFVWFPLHIWHSILFARFCHCDLRFTLIGSGLMAAYWYASPAIGLVFALGGFLGNLIVGILTNEQSEGWEEVLAYLLVAALICYSIVCTVVI